MLPLVPSSFHMAARLWRALAWSMVLILVCGCGKSQPRVVLYCAQDREFAEDILTDFTAKTGLAVDVKFDTEADKSVSLALELSREKKRPRCDVHWNNEILRTIHLQHEGILEPYASPAAAAYPASARAKDHSWTAFASRARIILVNTKLVPKEEWPVSILDLVKPRWKNRVAMAKPSAGTTATHAACLFEVLDIEPAKGFYRDLRKNGVHIVQGNKQVAVGVGQGQFAAGMTDTDDAIAEVKAGKPVAIIFPDRDRPKDDRMGTLFLPNTLAAIHGCPNPEGAHRLVDFLLSPEIESRLAESESHQIPLNPTVKARLPREIETPATVKAMEVDFDKAAELWDEVQNFMRNEIARP